MFGFGVYDVLKNYEDNACEMTYMFQLPEYMVMNKYDAVDRVLATSVD